MAEQYTPGPERVKAVYATYTEAGRFDSHADAEAQFTRFLARVRRDAEAAVLREAAEYMNDDQDAQYLVDCARDIEESP